MLDSPVDWGKCLTLVSFPVKWEYRSLSWEGYFENWPPVYVKPLVLAQQWDQEADQCLKSSWCWRSSLAALCLLRWWNWSKPAPSILTMRRGGNPAGAADPDSNDISWAFIMYQMLCMVLSHMLFQAEFSCPPGEVNTVCFSCTSKQRKVVFMIKAEGFGTYFWKQAHICKRLWNESFSLKHDLKIPGSVWANVTSWTRLVALGFLLPCTPWLTLGCF